MSSSEWPGADRAAEFVGEPAGRPRAFIELPLGLSQAGEPARESAHDAARREIAERVAEAYARGRAEGAAEAAVRHAEETCTALAALGESVRGIAAREERAIAEWAPRSIALAGEIAERVLRASLAEDIARIVPCVDEALATLASQQPVALALAPSALATLRAGNAETLAAWADASGVALQSDPSLAHGEAALVAGSARVELRWRAVVERLRVALEERLPLTEVAP
jgi:flagellar biosynthesis/type III secretory pathway protein FliH